MVKIATTQPGQCTTKTVEEDITLACWLIEQAGLAKADIVLLPEHITVRSVSNSVVPFELPGTLSDRFAELAKRFNMYVIGWCHERHKKKIFNTSFIIDRKGSLIGKYRKVHLTPVECENGIVPADTYPVFELDFGKIGIMICFDNYFPETARILSLQGAQVIFYPLAGDSLEWDIMTKSRAMDNGVYIVSSKNGPGGTARSCIIDPAGNIIVEADPAQADICTVSIDLNVERITDIRATTKPQKFAKLLKKCRRPDTYKILVDKSLPDRYNWDDVIVK